MAAASSISFRYCSRRASSTWAVGGASAGAATNSFTTSQLLQLPTSIVFKTYQSGISNKLASEPKEGLLEVIVGLGADIVVLKVLFPVEGDSLCLHLALLHIDLVAAENDGDVLADTGEVT